MRSFRSAAVPRLILTASLTAASYPFSSRARFECNGVGAVGAEVRFGGFPDNVQLAKTLVTEVLEGMLHSCLG